MMCRWIKAAVVGFAVLGALAGQPANRVERWRQDLDAFARILHGTYSKDFPPGQADLAKLYPNLDRDVAALKESVPNLRDGQIQLRLQRIMAGAHVAHNSSAVSAPEGLPVSFEWLADGLAIVGASDELKNLIGMRVVKVGNRTAAEMLEALSPYISSETEQWTRVLAQGILRNSTVLEGIGAVENGSVVLTLEGPAGTRTEKIFFSSWQTKQIPIWDALGYPVFLARSNSPEEYYWHAFLEDSKTLYIQYNRCAADPKLPFADFTSSVLKDIDEHRPHRVVVDLRFNTGGNSRVIQPLIQGLSARRKVIGVPYALIGPITFSSGIMAANDLRNKAKAKLVGSPTGGLLGGYGEAPERRLPNSGVNVQWTIKKFNSGRQIKPDIKAEMRLEDVLVGRDAVLEAALTAP